MRRRAPMKRTLMRAKPPRRAKMTDEQYWTVMNRAGGRCEAQLPTVCTGSAEEWHHRRRRGVGDDPHAASNGAALCQACHHHITHVSPAEGRDRGLIVSAIGVATPGEVPMIRMGKPVILHDDGTWMAVTLRG